MWNILQIGLLVVVVLLVTEVSAEVQLKRLADGPIIHPELHPSIGANIQGPSVIRVPDWVSEPLGNYYLYFADHKGAYIRLAYADEVTGPWKIHIPGSLQIDESHFLTEPPPVSEQQENDIRQAFIDAGVKVPHDPIQEVTAPHIASPDVHVDDINQRIVMYYHGLEAVGHQVTRVATSPDGIRYKALPEVLGRTYWRRFTWENNFFALAMPGQLYRSSDMLTGWQQGPRLFNKNMRHNAVLLRGARLYVFWTQVGDVPESILLSHIDLQEDWNTWSVEGTHEVLRPEHRWEGADAPLEPSMRSTAYGMVNQLRDPAIFQEGERVYLFYATAGEAGIGLAEVKFPKK